MLRIIVLLSTLMAGGVALAEMPPRAPDWTLDSVDGRSIDFYTDAAGHPAVLLFWASWCPYCRALFPHLVAVQADYAARGVRFYALNVWEDGDPAAYFREHGYHMTLLPAADLVAEDYGVHGTPAVVVTDGAQRIHYVRPRGAGPDAVEQALRTTLDTLLEATP
ncbi:MAG: TlpA family protein disulfide reductase [Gammaproteobacteria bacterium]|nr:TlpA family protein disulfide reductase [Gammaproteobacteria bacterium]